MWVSAGCGIRVQTEGVETGTPFLITVTLPPTFTPRPSETPSPLPPTPTFAPVEGITSTQLNVRAEPSTASAVLGIIPANTKVEIIGRDPGGNWWQIVYPAGSEGKGWVTAQYVSTAGIPEVPVVGSGASDPNVANIAVVLQQLNVRSGPGTNFNSLGTLNVNDVVTLTGKNSNGTWLQIEFPNGPDGKAWISAAFVRVDNVDVLPIVADTGEIVGTGTPVNTPLPPTPTLVPAPIDNDSAENPLVRVMFNPLGTRLFIYTGDVSAPNGDAEDWIAFTPYGDVVFAQIECEGSGSIRIEWIEGRADLVCGEPLKAFPVRQGMQVLLHIQAIATAENLQYTKYTLTIQAGQ
ncbi:MAG TPA: SH3 domain-containing protein [Anaerolineales bacterium]|nr:SH3 domain-containing protein [Anaerolineales bacterium]